MALILPSQLAKSGSEHGEQTALFAWAAVARIFGFAVAFDWADGKLVTDLQTYGKEQAVPELEWLHAIPNGGSRGDDERSRAIRGGQMKAEGVRNGVADIFLPVPVWHEYSIALEIQRDIKWCGLYIEMKKSSLKPKKEDSKGGLSPEQENFRDFVLDRGYGWRVCYTWRDAAETVAAYMTYKG